MSFSISDPSTRTSFSVSLNSMDFIRCTESYGGGTGVSPVQPGGDARLSTGMAGPARASAPHTVYSIVCQTHPTEPVASGQWPVASFGTEDDLPGSTEFRLTQKASGCRAGYWQLGTGNWQLATAFQGGLVRKYLGVLGGVAALCVMSWAQVPAPTPTPDQVPAQAPAPEPTPIPAPPPPASRVRAPQYPRFELFGGGTYAETGFFNAGHWAGLPGWDASLGANATSWLGFVLEGGQYFGPSKTPSLVPAPFPSGQFYEPTPSPTFNVATREYNFLFGVQFFRRKYGRWTPFAELLYGHQGARGVATPQTGSLVTEIGTGRAIVTGAGLDRQMSRRFAVRFKADYLQTGTAFPGFGKQKQDNFRFSMGIVLGNVHKKKRTLEDETQPEP